MMALFLILFILTCLYFFLRSINRMTGIFTRTYKTSKKMEIVKKEPETYIPEEVKADPVPTITNIQNNYNTTQILIIDNRPKE